MTDRIEKLYYLLYYIVSISFATKFIDRLCIGIHSMPSILLNVPP